jgi:hypothetical protein
MRFVLPLVALCALSSVPLRASDIFDITLTGGLSGNGTLTTDGTCPNCIPVIGGLLSLTINIGPDSGADAFDITDDNLGVAEFFRTMRILTYSATNSETGDMLHMFQFSTWIWEGGGAGAAGTYSITPEVPEPRSLVLLMPAVALVGLRVKYQRHRA